MSFDAGFSTGQVDVGSVLEIGNFTWTGGSFNGLGAGALVRVTGQTTISPQTGPFLGLYGTRLVLGTTSSWTNGGTLRVGANGIIEINSGGVFQINGPATLFCDFCIPDARVLNAGTVRKLGDGVFSANFINVDNAGLIDITGGTVSLQGGVSSGSFVGAAGTVLRLGNHALGAASAVNTIGTVESTGDVTFDGSFSAGNVVFSSGITTFGGTVGSLGMSMEIASGAEARFDGVTLFSLPPLTLNGGILSGTANVSTDSLTWYAGSVRGTGTLQIMGVTLVDTDGDKLISQRTLRLGTSTLWRAARVFLASSSNILNPSGATLQFDSSAPIEHGGGAPSNFVNEGTIHFLGPARRLVLPNFVNTGTLVQRIAGLVPGTEFDQVVVSGAAALGGTLDVKTVGGFVPASGDGFDVLTYGSRSGEFASIQGNGETYTASYGSSALTLTKP
jgi:hypothetical protein